MKNSKYLKKEEKNFTKISNNSSNFTLLEFSAHIAYSQFKMFADWTRFFTQEFIIAVVLFLFTILYELFCVTEKDPDENRKNIDSDSFIGDENRRAQFKKELEELYRRKLDHINRLTDLRDKARNVVDNLED